MADIAPTLVDIEPRPLTWLGRVTLTARLRPCAAFRDRLLSEPTAGISLGGGHRSDVPLRHLPTAAPSVSDKEYFP